MHLNRILLLVIILLVTSSFTQLRVFFLGVSEISALLFVLTILYLSSKEKLKFTNKFISLYWFTFIILISISLYINVILKNVNSSSLSFILFDYFSYIFILIVIFCLEIYLINNSIDFLLFFKRLYTFTFFIFSFLYIYGQFSNNFLGMSIYYYDYFSPLSNNIHQTAMYLSIFPYLGLFLVNRNNKIVINISIILSVVILIHFIILTGSFKAILGIYFGAILIILVLILRKFRNTTERILLIIVVLFFGTVLYFIQFEEINEALSNEFTTNDVGDGRAILYTQAITKIQDSFLFGYGPGSHLSYDGLSFNDAHQSFATIMLQGGILGLLIFIIIIYKLFSSIKYKPIFLMVSLSPIIIYFLGGDVLRKLGIWVIVLMIYYYKVPKEIED